MLDLCCLASGMVEHEIRKIVLEAEVRRQNWVEYLCADQCASMPVLNL